MRADEVFQIGDRVMVSHLTRNKNRNLSDGDCGTVVGFYSTTAVCVRWDKNIGGHACGGRCENGFGWNVCLEEIEPEPLPAPVDADLFL